VFGIHTLFAKLINKNGKFYLFHVPARYFREYERLHGWVLKNLNSLSYFRITVQFSTTFGEIDFVWLGGYECLKIYGLKSKKLLSFITCSNRYQLDCILYALDAFLKDASNASFYM
jgi:hypothetical protein